MEYELDCNEKRMLVLASKYDFDFSDNYRTEIKSLLEKEYDNYMEGSSEYIRFLCGYLYCIGYIEDLELIKKVKYDIDMDVETMIDSEWVESMENGYRCRLLDNHKGTTYNFSITKRIEGRWSE